MTEKTHVLSNPLRLLLDTNVILDSFLKRPDLHHEPDQIMQMVASKKIVGYLCADSVTTLYYLMKRHKDKAFAEERTALLLALFEVSPVDKVVLEQARKVGVRDFEDAVIFISAQLTQVGHKNIDNKGLDGIVTRNIKDFTLSEMRVYSPSEILAVLGGE